MPTFYYALRLAGDPARQPAVLSHGLPPPPGPIPAPAQLALASGRVRLAQAETRLAGANTAQAVAEALGPAVDLGLLFDPGALELQAYARGEVLHYFRLADATVKPLPAAPPPLRFLAGDAYVAVTAGARRLAQRGPGGASPTVARFIHLRDYFNAERLAEALLEHLLEAAAEVPPGTGVLVVECR